MARIEIFDGKIGELGKLKDRDADKVIQRLEELAGLEEQREQKKGKLGDIDADKLKQMADDAGLTILGLSMKGKEEAWKSEAIPTCDEILTVARNMREYGGSFVESLGAALFNADADNALKIKIAFHDYWVNYGGRALPDESLSEEIEFDKEQEALMDDDRDTEYRDERLENHFDQRDHYNRE